MNNASANNKQTTPAGARVKVGNAFSGLDDSDHRGSTQAAAQELRRPPAGQGPGDLATGRAAALLLARLVAGCTVGPAAIAALPEPWRQVAERVSKAGRGRLAALRAALSGLPDSGDILRAVLAVDPSSEPGAPISVDELTAVDVPELPRHGRIPDDLVPAGTGAGLALNEYVRYAEAISPMTPRLFHESAGLWLASAAIARRLKLPMAFGDVYPNIYVLWLAQSTLYRKSTALPVARDLARDLFPHLLAAHDSTPEALLSDMAGKEPTHMQPADVAEWKEERNYCAQRALIYDEMSALLASAGRDYNSGLLEAFLRFYDCDPIYKRSTRTQGRIVVRNTYLCVLGASTPAAMQEHLQSERLWSNGWWPRFAILTPEDSRPAWREPRETQRPEAFVATLRNLYQRLPPTTWPEAPIAFFVTLADGVFDIWNNYNRAVSYDMLQSNDFDDRLAGTYGRLPVHALKVATLLAALDWATPNLPQHKNQAPRIELPHIVRAIGIVEEWRASTHRALRLATESEYAALSRRIMRHLAAAEPDGLSIRELARAMRDKRPTAIEAVVLELVAGGLVEEAPERTSTGRPTKRYRLARG